jgi:hypothetical protein
MVPLEFFIDIILSATLSLGGPVGEPGGVSWGFICWDFLREREKCISGFYFFVDPEDIKSLSLWAIWNCSKGAGLP